MTDKCIQAGEHVIDKQIEKLEKEQQDLQSEHAKRECQLLSCIYPPHRQYYKEDWEVEEPRFCPSLFRAHKVAEMCTQQPDSPAGQENL